MKVIPPVVTEPTVTTPAVPLVPKTAMEVATLFQTAFVVPFHQSVAVVFHVPVPSVGPLDEASGSQVYVVPDAAGIARTVEMPTARIFLEVGSAFQIVERLGNRGLFCVKFEFMETEPSFHQKPNRFDYSDL